MRIPPGKMNIKKFNAFLQRERKQRYRRSGDQTICKTCQTPVVIVTCCVSYHARELDGCAGSGEVDTVGLEFCPRCEVVPDATETVRSCVHERMFMDTGMTFTGF